MLSIREADVLTRFVNGATTAEIAYAMGMRLSEVQNLLTDLCEVNRARARQLLGVDPATTAPGGKPTMTDTPFDEWVILELLGHRRLAGRVREVQLAGAGFLRLDIPATDGHEAQTQLIAPGSVYALHPTTQEVATAAAARFRPAPVSRWELEPVRRPDEYSDPWAGRPADDEDLDDEDELLPRSAPPVGGDPPV